jgi:hypothetical protein
MRGWRQAVVVAGVGVTLWAAATTVLAQRQFQFFAHFSDASGKPIAGLTEADIAVQEDGATGKVLKLEPFDWPMKVAVLIDNGTGSSERLNHTREGVKGLLRALPPGVEASLQTTAPQPRYLVRPTTDKGALLSGVNLLTPDSSAGRFVDGLIETSARFDKERADKERGNFFPVIVIVGSLTAEGSAIRDRDVQRLFQQLAARAMTTHIVMVGPTNQSGTTNVSNAIQIGISAAKQTGGRYESIAATTRLQTLLPEIGALIDEADQRQRTQYRVTFERPEGKSGPQVGGIGLSGERQMVVKLSLDGHMP